jgi:hypothetical protein
MRRCWACGKGVGGGKPVRMDFVLGSARAVKRLLGVSRESEVVVCVGCEKKHAEKVGQFDAAMLKFGLLGLVAFIAYGWLSNYLVGLFWGLFVFALSLFKYAPRCVE